MSDYRCPQCNNDITDLVETEARETVSYAESEINQLEASIQSKQAKIDSLMLEYCPDEMTEEQKTEWAKHQKPA